MPRELDRKELLVVWKHPDTRQRYLIGRLWREGAEYHFRYEEDLPRSIREAEDAGFPLLEAFPAVGGEWTADVLFPVFRRRLPRQWFLPRLRAAGIDVTDPMELLRVTGGRLPTDTLEFLEPIEKGDESGASQEYTVRFPVAGWRYYGGECAIHELVPGQVLRLKLEPENRYDPNAIRIFSPSGVLLGYVPAIYAWYMDAAVERGEYEATVERIGPPQDPQQRVTVRFRGLESPLDRARLVPDGLEKYAATLAVR